MNEEKYIVLLFYKYVKIEHPEIEVSFQRDICKDTDIKGRVLIGLEGINGTVAGTREEVDHYMAEMRKDQRFSDIDFKEGESDFMPFNKLKIKARKEVVTLGLGNEDIDMQNTDKGTYLEPDQMYELLNSGEEFYIIDARNTYESKIGKFKNAITPDIENFRDFPKALEELDHLKDKKVVFYCTGGIRCEKATAYAKKKGFKDVYQLHGGIQRFAEKYPKGGYEGAMYVFDDRIQVTFDKSDDRVILTECEYCKEKCDEYKNCFNAKCNKRMIICDECFKKNEGCCSEECKEIKYPRKEYRFQDKL